MSQSFQNFAVFFLLSRNCNNTVLLIYEQPSTIR